MDKITNVRGLERGPGNPGVRETDTKKPCTVATAQGQNCWLVSRTHPQEGLVPCH